MAALRTLSSQLTTLWGCQRGMHTLNSFREQLQRTPSSTWTAGKSTAIASRSRSSVGEETSQQLRVTDLARAQSGPYRHQIAATMDGLVAARHGAAGVRHVRRSAVIGRRRGGTARALPGEDDRALRRADRRPGGARRDAARHLPGTPPGLTTALRGHAVLRGAGVRRAEVEVAATAKMARRSARTVRQTAKKASPPRGSLSARPAAGGKHVQFAATSHQRAGCTWRVASAPALIPSWCLQGSQIPQPCAPGPLCGACCSPRCALCAGL